MTVLYRLTSRLGRNLLIYNANPTRPRQNYLQKLVCIPERQMYLCGDMSRSTVILSWAARVEEP